MAGDLINIVKLFNIEGETAEIVPFGSGHINDTFKVTTKGNTDPNYLLQQINQEVFTDVEGLMKNITEITAYLKTEIIKPAYRGVNHEVLELVLTHSGNSFVKENGFWRMYRFMDHLRSYDRAHSSEQVYEGAKAFGLFLNLLQDFPNERLAIPIKDFHNIITRLDTLNTVYSNLESLNLKNQVKKEINYIHEVADEMSSIQKLMNAGKIPIRVTHNDTKFNNVLLDQDDQAKCVIDLDTVMPGIVHYDFGDGIRTGACLADEDEKDLQLVDIDLERFEAFTEGYLESAGHLLTPFEIEYLAKSATLFPYMMGVRFLADYLQGSTYYKIDYPDHNLVRAKAQIHLSRMILGRMDELETIVGKHIR